jgi:pimeloyl-ACP methyl ester carboxylesterase
MHDFYTRGGDVPPWGSPTCPGLRAWVLTPGVIAAEAAAVDVPVLLAFGERDVTADPWMEPKAYPAASDITLFVCQRMGHMHNFAGTREKFWARIHSWGTWVATTA